MFRLQVWLGVAWLAVACSDRGADRPDGRRDSGTERSLPDGGSLLGGIGPLGETSWTPLLDDSLSLFYRWMPSKGRDKDPQGVFAMDGGVLHVLGIPATDQQQDYGYLATLADIGDYRARAEQKWGTKTFAPRLGQLRDNGFLYHLRGEDKIWPQCVEFQIMEYNTGDLWVLAGAGVTAPVADPRAAEPTFDPLGPLIAVWSGRVIHWWDAARLTDWNTLELIASGQDATQIVNGQWVNGARNIVAKDGDGGYEPLSHGHLAVEAEGAEVYYRNFEIRPLAYLPPPPEAEVLFDGSNLDAWQGTDGGVAGWTLFDGGVEVVPGSGDIRTRQAYGDMRLHLEFQVPPPQPNAAEQDRGNSGVYLQARYEVQILDSFGHVLSDANDCGAIYGVKDATVNESFPPDIWQSYDIVFHAPVWNGTTKTSNARITVVWNGSVVQQSTEVPGSTTLGDPEAPGNGPLRLQDHGHPVRFRNIWIAPIPDGGFPEEFPDGGAADAGVGDGGVADAGTTDGGLSDAGTMDGGQ